MAKRFYVDRSAHRCILLGENGHAALETLVGGSEILSSVLLVIETTRSLVRLSREQVLSSAELQDALARLEKDSESFQLRDLTLDLCTGLTMPVVSTPGSLDLAHLRTALWFHSRKPLTRFVTLDEPRRRAAGELGLPI